MSLKVSKGRKITATHTNKIVDAICSLQKTPLDFSKDLTGTVQSMIQIPAFSLCWYQYSDDGIVVYNNTQGNPDNIVYYNGTAIPYCGFGYTLPETCMTYGPSEALSGDAIKNANYLAVLTIDSTDAIDPTVRIVKNILSATETDGEASTASEQDSTTISTDIYYTFARTEDISAVWSNHEILGTYPIGKYENLGIKQIHHGLIIDGIDTELIADSDLSVLELSSIQISTYVDPCTEEISEYIQLFDAQKGFDEPLPRTHHELAGQPQCIGLRTILLHCGQYGTPCTCGEGICEEVDTTTGTFVRYGAAEEFYILNDHDGIETYNFVTPRHVATYQHITVGCMKDEDLCTATTTEDPEGPSDDLATIYFSKPLVIEFQEDESDEPPDPACGETEGNGLSGNLISGDLIFTICNNKAGAPMHGDWEGQFKTFIPTQVSAACYMEVSEYKNIYSVYGPAICVKYIELSGPCSETGDEEQAATPTTPTAIFYETCTTTGEDGELSTSYMHWDLYIDPPISAGDYLVLSDGVMYGPELSVGCLSNITGGIEYDEEGHAWIICLTAQLSTELDLSATDICAGDYIKIDSQSHTEEEDNITTTFTSYKITGPEIDIAYLAGDPCSELQPKATFNESSHTWELKIPKPEEQLSVGLSAGQYIKVEDEEKNKNTTLYTVVGPEIQIMYYTSADVSADMDDGDGCDSNNPQCTHITKDPTAVYNEVTHTWTLKIPPMPELSALSSALLSTELSAGDYIKIEEVVNETTNLTAQAIIGPRIEFSYYSACDLSGDQTIEDLPTTPNAEYDAASHVWKLKMPELSALSGTSDLSAGDYITISENKIHGAGITVECTETIKGTATYSEGSWTLELNTINDGDSYTAGDYITIDEETKTINGAGITIACTATVKGSANYNNGSWELNLEATVDPEDIEMPNSVCVVAGNYITVNHATANNVDTYTINGPNMVISKAVGIDAQFLYTNGTWYLGLCSDGNKYNAGNYITIDSNNNINGSAVAIGTTKGITASSTHANGTWTINLEADPPKAGNYITVGTDGSINGAAMAIGKSVGIDAGFTYTNGTWTLNLCTDGGGVPSVNGIEDAVTITSNSLNVATNGNTITIEDPNGPNVVYTFDEEWFCVSGTHVSLNSGKIEAIGEEIAICAYSTITPVATAIIDTTDNKGVTTDIVVEIVNGTADIAAVTVTGVPRTEE